MDASYESAPYRTLTVQPYARSGNVPGSSVGSALSLTENPSGSGYYTFSLDSLSNGDYFVSVLNFGSAYGHFKLRKETTSYKIGREWWELDLNDTITDAGGVTVTVVSPVSTDGQLVSPIIIGDDYLAANSRAFVWTIPVVTGVTMGTATCSFGGARGDDTWLVTGTLTAGATGYWVATFDLPRASTVSLSPGWYRWSVEVKAASDGAEATVVATSTGRGVELRRKQT